MKKLLKESILLVFAVLPLVYLAFIWEKLPDTVPIHFNIDGTADGWSSKTSLIYLIGALSFVVYLLLIIIPFIDPKKKIQQMGDKFYNLRFVLSFFMSLIAIYIVYVTSVGDMKDSNLLFVIIGALFAMLGNYFQTIRPNYFIGIKTPWTLESEAIWKKTHRLGGQIWMVAGVLIAVLSFFVKNSAFAVLFIAILSVMVIVPIVFSYLEFLKEKSKQKTQNE